MKLSTKHREHLRGKYKGCMVIPVTKQYFEETEYSDDQRLVQVHTVGFNDSEYYELIAVNTITRGDEYGENAK